MNKPLICYLILVLGHLSWFSCSPPPITREQAAMESGCSDKNWYPQPSPSDNYYQGVGSASFDENIEKTKSLAKQSAYLDLVSSISISIKGSVVDSVWEGMGISGEFIKQVVETYVKQHHLTDVEVVDMCIEKPYNDVHIYLRLSKYLYKQKQLQQRKLALENSLRYFSEGNYELAKNHYELALQKYLTSYYYSRFLLGEFQDIEYPENSGILVNIDTEISKKIETLLSGIVLIDKETPMHIKAHRHGVVSLSIKAMFELPGRYGRSLKRLPLLFKDETGSVELEPLVMTDRFGYAKSYIKRVAPNSEVAIINCQLALDSIYIEQENIEELLPVIYSNVFVPPFIRVEIPIRPLYIYFEGTETIEGGEVMESEKFVSKALQEFMTNAGGFAFVDSPRKADLIMELNVNCKLEGYEDGFYWYKAFMSASIRKSITGDEIYSDIFEPVKYGGIDRRRGGIFTLEKAGNTMRAKIAHEIVSFLKSESMEKSE